MSGVDVLSVLDEFALYVRNVSSRHALSGDIAAARAAVADLIEENKRLRVKAYNWDSLLHARAETNAEPDDCEWKQLARKRLLIPSIKACRAAHGYSLMEAKDCVDSYIARCKGEQA